MAAQDDESHGEMHTSTQQGVDEGATDASWVSLRPHVLRQELSRLQGLQQWNQEIAEKAINMLADLESALAQTKTTREAPGPSATHARAPHPDEQHPPPINVASIEKQPYITSTENVLNEPKTQSRTNISGVHRGRSGLNEHLPPPADVPAMKKLWWKATMHDALIEHKTPKQPTTPEPSSVRSDLNDHLPLPSDNSVSRKILLNTFRQTIPVVPKTQIPSATPAAQRQRVYPNEHFTPPIESCSLSVVGKQLPTLVASRCPKSFRSSGEPLDQHRNATRSPQESAESNWAETIARSLDEHVARTESQCIMLEKRLRQVEKYISSMLKTGVVEMKAKNTSEGLDRRSTTLKEAMQVIGDQHLELENLRNNYLNVKLKTRDLEKVVQNYEQDTEELRRRLHDEQNRRQKDLEILVPLTWQLERICSDFEYLTCKKHFPDVSQPSAPPQNIDVGIFNQQDNASDATYEQYSLSLENENTQEDVQQEIRELESSFPLILNELALKIEELKGFLRQVSTQTALTE
ncbi:uncharacterized protein LOC134536720 [Bacillus rossius redtenbacheri]|uniref:uncharacterized protein LOC134536720 n=1 Tax=Bacillus rossius redtenbacheri TaxID=93214 RepID=UPI002FDEEAB3